MEIFFVFETKQRRVYDAHHDFFRGTNSASFIQQAWGHGTKRTLSWLGQGCTWTRPHSVTLRLVQKRKLPRLQHSGKLRGSVLLSSELGQEPNPHDSISMKHSWENSLGDRCQAQGLRSTFEKQGHEESAKTSVWRGVLFKSDKLMLFLSWI